MKKKGTAKKAAPAEAVNKTPSKKIGKASGKRSSKKAKPAVPAQIVHGQPPYSCKVLGKAGVVRVSVTLHRIPHQCINFTPTEDHFYLDTFKYTKKLLLK